MRNVLAALALTTVIIGAIAHHVAVAQLPGASVQTGVACSPDAPPGQSAGRLSASVTADRAVYAVGTPVTITLTVTNPTDISIETRLAVLLPTFQIRTSDGEFVWQYPPLPYPLPVGRCVVAPGGGMVATILWDQRRSIPGQLAPGEPVPAGRYVVTGGLAGVQADTIPASFTIEAIPPSIEAVPLLRACTNVALTWPDATPLATVAGAISPASRLHGIWRLDPVQGRFLGWSPLTGAPNDLMTVNRLDAVFICMSEPGQLLRPMLLRSDE